MNAAEEITALQERVAYQDQSIVDLSDELYRQQQQIAALEEVCKRLSAQLEAGNDAKAAADGESAAQIETPPHY